MTRKEAIKHLEEWKECISSAYRRQVIDMAIEALEGKDTNVPTKDCISRQDAIEAVQKVWCNNDDQKDFKQRYYEMGNNDAVEDAIGYIDALPSAEPKTGEWVKVIDEETSNVTKWHYECDQCGAGRFENGQQHCSRCGARMLGEDGEE